jgi:NADPH:quinone reductase-like Zn-dependent oxidoreductase
MTDNQPVSILASGRQEELARGNAKARVSNIHSGAIHLGTMACGTSDTATKHVASATARPSRAVMEHSRRMRLTIQLTKRGRVRAAAEGVEIQVAIDSVGGRLLDDVADLLAERAGTIINFGSLGGETSDIPLFHPALSYSKS